MVGISISSEYQRAEGVELFQMLLLFVGPQRGRRLLLGRVVVSGGGPFLACVLGLPAAARCTQTCRSGMVLECPPKQQKYAYFCQKSVYF